MYTINHNEEKHRLLKDFYGFLETEGVDSSFQILELEETILIEELD